MAKRVYGREDDVGVGASLGQAALVTHQRDMPGAFLPSAQAGRTAKAKGLLLGACHPFARTVLTAPTGPGVGDESIGALGGYLKCAVVIVEA